MTIFRDSLGYAHTIEPLLKAGPAAFTPDPHQGQFRALVDDMIALRDRRRRVAEKVKVPANTRDRPAEKEAERVSRADHIRQTPARPAAKPTAEKPLRKSLAELAAEAQRMTAEVQRDTARALIADLTAQARAGRLGAIEAAKLDALQHRHARALGMETTGVRS